MNNLLLAIQFFTIIPVNPRFREKGKRLSDSVIYFPLVGLLLGVILAALNFILSYIFLSQVLINVILVVALIILTGGLHLDGLADTFDALLSIKDKEEFLEIMRDPRIGTMGVLSLISVLLLKVVLLCALNPIDKNLALILMCTLSRWSLVLPIYSFPYARSEGKAKDFFAQFSFTTFIVSAAGVLMFTILALSLKGIFVFTAMLLFTFIFNRFMNRKIGGITGDILGATLEINEVIILLCMAAIFGV